MRRMAVAALAATLFLGVSELSAQAKANFAGAWTRVDDPNAPPPTGRGGGRGGLGASAKIEQDAKALTIIRTTQAGETKAVYNLDGSDSKNMVAGRGGGAGTETVSKTKWDGNKLVITTNITVAGNPAQQMMTMSLDASGNLLVESTATGRDGAPATTKTTYKKG